jgi:simple sugar transport system permease protein
MRVDLIARTHRSRLRELLAPVAAMAVAIVVGGVVIALMGRSPLTAFDVYFVQPLTQS